MPATEKSPNPSAKSLQEAVSAAKQVAGAEDHSTGADAGPTPKSEASDAGSKTIQVDVGGTKREFTEADLSKIISSQADLENREAAVQSQMARIASTSDIAEALKDVDPEALNVIRKFAKDPESFRPQAPLPEEDDSPLDAIFGDRNTVETRGTRQVASEAADMRREIADLRNIVQSQVVAPQAQQTLEGAVDAAMNQYPILRGGGDRMDAARSLAHRAVMAEVGLNGTSALDGIVGAVANSTQKLFDADQGVRSVMDSPLEDRAGSLVPRTQTTSNDLESGKIMGLVEDLIEQTARGRTG